MPLSSGPCFSRVSRPKTVFKLCFVYFIQILFGRSSNTLVPASPNRTQNARPSLHTRTLRLPPRMRASFTDGASAIPSGHSCSTISRHRWLSGADTVRDNFGRATTSDTSGAECCRFSGGRPFSTGSGHTQGPRSSGSFGSAVTVALPVGIGVDGPVLGVVGSVLGVGGAQCSGLPRVLGCSGLTRGPISSQIRGSNGTPRPEIRREVRVGRAVDHPCPGLDPPDGWWAAIILHASLLVMRVLMMLVDFDCLSEAWAPFNDTSVPSLPLCSIPLFPSASPSYYPELRYSSLLSAVFPLPSADF